MMTKQEQAQTAPSQPPTVLCNGARPLCHRKIGVYRRPQPLRTDTPVCFADVNDAGLPLPPGQNPNPPVSPRASTSKRTP